jgi:hypothetical protein
VGRKYFETKSNSVLEFVCLAIAIFFALKQQHGGDLEGFDRRGRRKENRNGRIGLAASKPMLEIASGTVPLFFSAAVKMQNRL